MLAVQLTGAGKEGGRPWAPTVPAAQGTEQGVGSDCRLGLRQRQDGLDCNLEIDTDARRPSEL